jgi:hypothetical protein
MVTANWQYHYWEENPVKQIGYRGRPNHLPDVNYAFEDGTVVLASISCNDFSIDYVYTELTTESGVKRWSIFSGGILKMSYGDKSESDKAWRKCIDELIDKFHG